jgi:hypothetical protein
MSQAHAEVKPSSSVLDLMLDPVSRCFDTDSAKRLLDLRIDPAVQERVDVLASKANEGLLTEAEKAEYEACINTDDFISILKLKARTRQLVRMRAGGRSCHVPTFSAQPSTNPTARRIS